MNVIKENNMKSYEKRKTKIAIRMAIIYTIIYLGFIVLNVFKPLWMSRRAIFGLNLAVSYGIGLIILAIIFAVIYNQICKIPKSKTGDR